ncbi:MAG: Trp biosynthesis-associated membrane protein [Actinomycetota bacterium]|nr:Trp biosynthesis-associated membrane protein [Actinomycetota bacterium]
MSEHRSEDRASPAMDRRGLLLAVIGCVGSAAAMLLASGQGWLRVSLPARAPLPGASQTLTGQEVVDALVPLGILVGVAGLALIATRRIGRLLVASVVLLAGLTVVAVVGSFLYDDGSLQASQWAQARAPVGESLAADREVVTWPAILALVGGLVAVAVGSYTLLRSRCWAVMGARYERRTASTADDRKGAVAGAGTAATTPPAGGSETAMWAALERGEDPTAKPGPAGSDEAPGATRDQPLAHP